MTDRFVFDTYALIALLEGNPAYLKHSRAIMVINDFIFAEYCYLTLRRYVDYPEEADTKARSVINTILSLSKDVIMDAMKFRYENRKKDMSATDCVSYIHARQLGIPFLTGDCAFEGLPGVEFVR